MIDDEATSLINNQDADAYGTASTSGNDAGERENGIGKGEIKQIGKYSLSRQHMKGMRKLATNPQPPTKPRTQEVPTPARRSVGSDPWRLP
jgi:hypothetical protein